MFATFCALCALFALAIATATAINAVRQHNARARCYRRASLRSLVRAARRNAIARHYGRGV